MKNQREQNAGKEDTNEHGEKLSFVLILTCVRFNLNALFISNCHQKVVIVNKIYFINYYLYR